ncbi:MAG: ribosome silencing factor [Chlorobi bacterium]|nr:ribosome silencing factor [Chlorobiota bacterium]
MVKIQKLLKAILEGMTEKKAKNIVKIDFKGTQNSITDFFIICEAETDRQVEAVADSVERFVRKETGDKVFHKEGYDNAEWIILDYFDVVVHVFRSEFRNTYKLEDLWADAEISEIKVKYSSVEN